MDEHLLDGVERSLGRPRLGPEVTATTPPTGERIDGVPISSTGPEPEEGETITWRDGFGAAWPLPEHRVVS